MPTIRLNGTITARSPIMVTRPEQGDVLLTMNVVRHQSLTRAHVIPGETIKGLLRSSAYALCVDAAKLTGDLKVSLGQFYNQAIGGLSFVAEGRELGSDAVLRASQPLLSLFGAANPKLTGRIIVHHAIAQAIANEAQPAGIGLPPGARRDGIRSRPEMADLLANEDRALWSRQNAMVADLSEANKRVEDARRILGRARRTEGVDVARFEAELERAVAEVATIKASPEFQQSVQRPLPVKNAAPAGTVFDHAIEVVDGTEAEIGLLLATLELWHRAPRIGGGRTVGYGQIIAEYAIVVLSSEPLRRHRTWQAAGRATIGGMGAMLATTNETLIAAQTTWAETEAAIRTKTGIFN
jgi:CRISPR type IV-associated protein Csf2